MDKYLQICDYLESHLNEVNDSDYVEYRINEYRDHIKKNPEDTVFYDYWTKTLRNSLAQQLCNVIKRNNDYEFYKKIYGKPFYLERQKRRTVWTKKEVGRKVYKKNGDFESQDVSFFFPHFQSNDNAVRENITLMKKEAIDSVYEKLNNRPFNYDIPKTFLEVRQCIYRKNFDEVLITVGLRKDILDLKERIELGNI